MLAFHNLFATAANVLPPIFAVARNSKSPALHAIILFFLRSLRGHSRYTKFIVGITYLYVMVFSLYLGVLRHCDLGAKARCDKDLKQ